VFDCIGRGACGDVFRAWDTRLDREVALKLIPVGSAPGAASTSSIVREGRLLARVRHPSVVTIYGAEQIGARVGIWMELVHGRTLGQLAQSTHGLSPREVARIGLELAQAVEAVHGAGLIHGDIKSGNVMLADDGRVVLMDFGTSREVQDRPGDLAGTPLFLAPELLKGEPATPRSDIYSVGVVLYHLLTGSYPVDGITARAIGDAHAAGVRSSIQAVRTDLPAGLAHVIDRALEPSPERRYESAASLGEDLRRVIAPLPSRLGWVLTAVLCAATAGLIWQTRPTPTADFSSASSPEPPIVAVLPFEDLSGDREGELVAEGLSAEIVRSLAAIEGLAVRPVMPGPGRENPASDERDLGRQVGANLVLSGTVSASRGRLRVGSQLTRTSDGVTVWADAIVRDGADLFSAHEEISTAIVNRLRLRVGRGQRRYDIDPDAYYQFLKARGLQARRHVDNAGAAAELFERVIARNRGFAPGWAGLASALGAFSRAVPGDVLPPRNPRMEVAAMEAIRLDPLLADAHSAMGALHARDREWAEADAAFRQALALNPSQTAIHTEFVLAVLLPMGRLAEGLELLDAASAIEPLSLDVRRVRAMMEVETGRYRQALESARWVVERDAAFPFADLWLGRALVFLGRPDEAIEIFERSPDRFGYLGYLHAVNGRRREAEALAAAHPDLPARQMLIYAGLGDIDRALAALERTMEVNWWVAATWIQRPEMAILRGHPRLLAVQRRLGLAE
jgi:TolB-like protein/tetratricopeptide (TPR) repeat protein